MSRKITTRGITSTVPVRCFTYSSPEIPGSFVRVHGRAPKTKKDQEALEAIIKAAHEMLARRTP